MFGVFKKRSNKSSKRVNRKRRTSRRRTNRRRQRGGQSDYATAYGSGPSPEAKEGFKFEGEGFAAMKEPFAGHEPKEMEEAPAQNKEVPTKGGAGGKAPMTAGRRRRGRKNQGADALVPAVLLAANLYGPGSKSRRNRRKSRKNRSQRRR